MTLAVMSRASLGHTGAPLSAGGGTQAVYLLALLSALLRMLAGFDGSMMVMEAAGIAWAAAFFGFVLLYGPLLVRGRKS